MPENASRDPAPGFKWVESHLRGKIVSQRQNEHWRTQWFLDVDTGAGGIQSVVMRGFRNPGYASPTEAGARAMLKIEAGMLEVLQDMPVSAPKFHGYNEENGWLLMERLEGNTELTAVTDPDERFHIFQGYIEDIARLHGQPLEAHRVPPGLSVPVGTKALIDKYYDGHLAYYRAQPKRQQPEPLLEFGIQWLEDNRLKTERPMCLGLGDIGPNQFMFESGRYKALLDFEYAAVADPLMEIGLMRSREMTYPIGRFGEHLLHYGEYYRKLTGDSLDEKTLHYWTVFGVVVWPLLMNPAIQRPDPQLIDQAFLYSWEIHHRRCIAESLAEQYDIALEPPDLPQEEVSTLSPLHTLLVDQFEQHYGPRATDAREVLFARYSAAIARTLARGNAFGRQLDEANLRELSELLGSVPRSVVEGLRALEELVERDYEKDFDKRLRFFHRFELRKEYLYEPMQIATGCASRSPLSRLHANTIPPGRAI